MYHRQSMPDDAPYQTWDYNKHKNPTYTTHLGYQISTATAIDALRHRGLPDYACGRFSSIQDRLIMAPRSALLQNSAMLSADEAMAQIRRGG